MERILGHGLAIMCQEIGYLHAVFRSDLVYGEVVLTDEFRQMALERLRMAQVAFNRNILSDTLDGQLQRIVDRCGLPECHQHELEILLREFWFNLQREIEKYVFLMIAPGERDLYEQPGPLFGDDVDGAFPEARQDIAAAGRCKALGESTACVFHLMRVLEKGLQTLAQNVGVQTPKPLDQEEWMRLIVAIEERITAQQRYRPSQDLMTYSQLAANFRYFKDAWRNHVAHARTFYEAGEANTVWTHVQSFMQILAKTGQEGREQTFDNH